MKSICVFCGSNTGSEEVYRQTAIKLGQSLAARKIRLVYGAGNVGLMGVIADACLDAGGEVLGVIPHFLKIKEVCHTSLTQLRVTQTMHERKQMMADESDGFIAMPGGFGTLDELCEILTWGQLGLHNHPIGVLNVAGYFDPLLQMFDHMVSQRFLAVPNRGLVLSDASPQGLLEQMERYDPPEAEKWLDRSRT
ncbi:MAG: TIGR00730 family Rossman fold protein [Bacteroidota bacterium]